ncbi:MAG: hypothetical protein HQL54_05315 [Magnetococcales bacterium]|nr:hypothetical protein [Magnetococcales bacterium]
MTTTSTSSIAPRLMERHYCGVPVKFNWCVGIAQEISINSIFIILEKPCLVDEGAEGLLRLEHDDILIQEKAKVVRVENHGIAVISMEKESVLKGIAYHINNGIEYIHPLEDGIKINFKGHVNANCLIDFVDAYRNNKPGTKYLLDFHNATDITPSGIGMLLMMADHNKGKKSDIKLVNFNNAIQTAVQDSHIDQTAVKLDMHYETLTDTNITVQVEEEKRDDGQDQVVIRVNGVFDASCREAFIAAYRHRPENTHYLLDFANLQHLERPELGTILMLVRHNGTDKSRIKVINSNSRVRQLFAKVKLGRLLDFS